MRYAAAFKIGAVCEGMIQCTYATIYDADGKGLFSLQRTKAMRGYTRTSDSGVLITELNDNVYFDNQGARSWRDTEIGGGITIDLPLVFATEHSDDTLVPAYLTAEAIDIIGRALEKMKTTRYTIYRVADYTTTEMEKGEREVVKVRYDWSGGRDYNKNNNDHRYHYEVEVEKDIVNPRYQRVRDIINEGGIVYVKPAAFKWTPVDGYNATITDENGKTIKLADALEAAEKKVARAKAILAMAGATAIF